ncbi:MAG: hypothetical protein AL399_07165 [Candidatus [Bacteroides] periocalifornicus]|uniref:Uncharacterized protein n=1 Tax=Candidatus [Bacteroides] periocalifornicus TaxID=1702214 RepID=A0A0Q4B3H2_9BACT|nr:MAG: hypothetical protein AL399_07165 [Candidatus [Bacteroides] periocalifornicus]
MIFLWLIRIMIKGLNLVMEKGDGVLSLLIFGYVSGVISERNTKILYILLEFQTTFTLEFIIGGTFSQGQEQNFICRL